MAEKYKKFELEELPKSSVVNNSSDQLESDEIQEMIDEVVSDHLNKIVDTSDNEENQLEENNTNISTESSDTGQLDIDSLKQESYNLGYEAAKSELEPILQEKSSKDDLIDSLNQKLISIAKNIDIDEQIAKVSSESIAAIAKKLHLILPVDFEKIVTDGMLGKLKEFYTQGKVVLTVNPERYDYCSELLQSDEFSSKFNNNFEIIKSDDIPVNDCRLEWNETRLEYNQEQLNSEIDKIVEQLKTA